VATHRDSRPLVSPTLAQKILPPADAAKADVHGDRANHWAHDVPMMRPVVEDLGGLIAHGNGVGTGVFS
jgi:hypothetical protein